MITGVHTSCAEECGWLVPSNFIPSPQVPTHTFSLRLLSAFIGRSVRIRQCLRSFYHPCPFFFAPCAFFFWDFWIIVVLVKKKRNRTDVMHCRIWPSPSCFFFLVTFLLSHRRLALAALLPTRSSSEEPPSSAAAAYSVAWSGPAPGDRFGSGDTIVGEWQVTPQNQKIVSPSFRLCMGGEDGCGATIWPEVVEESEGSYYVSLYVFLLAKENKNK